MSARILVVEDDNIVALEIVETLNSLGYTVVGTASAGETAIEAAGKERPDLVLMDIRLKGAMDGVQAAAEIRARLGLPIVFLTAYADADTLERAKVTEPYGYIIKPFEHRELQTAIEIGLYKHETERRLRERERWLATTLRSVGDGVIAANESGLISFMNPIATALTGWEHNQALGRRSSHVVQILRADSRRRVDDPILSTLWDGRQVPLVDCLLVTRDGSEVPIEGNCRPIRDDRGSIMGAVLALRDVSERLRQAREKEELQAQLLQVQKMEAMGILAGGIAHDLSNLLTPVIGNSSLLLSLLADDDPLRERIEVIKRSGERAARLVQQILAFSRKQMPNPIVLDLNAVVIEMGDLLERLIGEDNELDRALGADLELVRVDPAQAQQVIMNLVVNAVEAMPDGGRLAIRTENATLTEEDCVRHPEAHPGRFVRLSITDTGVGLDGETAQRMFEPFFSTKDTGTGLGLSIVHNIVQQYAGWTEVHSEPGQGTTFEVYWPACEDAAETDPWRTPSSGLQGRGERILLVEDDDDVRATLSDMLRTAGYHVVAVGNGEEALRVFESERGRFHLLFSDVVLPDRDALELVDELLAQRPDLPVLLSSGYTDQRSHWRVIRDRGFPFVQKPYGLADLLPVVHQALQKQGSDTKPPQ